MKQAPDLKKLEELLRSSQIVAGGFMGTDARSLPEIVEADASALRQLGVTPADLAARMEHATTLARVGQGMPVQLAPDLEGVVEESRGVLVCPWPGPERFSKTTTTLTQPSTGASARWSDLSLHLIREHGFFQGHGSPYRLEPRVLVALLAALPAPPPTFTYVCQVCGYVYQPAKGEPLTGTPPGTAFEALPADWRCPMCGAPLRMFKKRK